MIDYNKEYKLWEIKEEERKHTFTITERNADKEGNDDYEENDGESNYKVLLKDAE